LGTKTEMETQEYLSHMKRWNPLDGYGFFELSGEEQEQYLNFIVNENIKELEKIQSQFPKEDIIISYLTELALKEADFTEKEQYEKSHLIRQTIKRIIKQYGEE
jgi:hypothetical protein